ncbi:MAG: nitrogenase component 1 [Phascolarctobacterium sp.]|nr:nitrogenase component 1 [Phascolarctobacterium sp.]
MSEPWGNVCNRTGSCALTGAAAFASSMPGCEIVINGPLWCYFYAMRFLEHNDHLLHERFHNSQPDNNAIVYGSEKDLTAELKRVFADGHKPEVLFIEASCSMSLIGDDLQGIAKKMQIPFPVVTMDCGGLIGGFREGYLKCAKIFINHFATENYPQEPFAVNILGLSDYYYNGKADREEICRILTKAGYKINCLPGTGSVYDLKNLSKATLNIVCNEEIGLELAEFLKNKFGTEYVLAGVPYGVQGTMQWLERIHACLPVPNLSLVEEEAKSMQEYLLAKSNDTRVTWPELWFDKCLISAPGTQALCLAEALRSEWVDVGKLTVICQEKLKHTAFTTMPDEILFAVEDEERIDYLFKNMEHVLLFASASELTRFQKRKADFISIGFATPVVDEVNFTTKPLVGIQGAAVIFEKIWNSYIQNIIRKSIGK